MMEVATFAPHAPYTPAPRGRERVPGSEGAAHAAYDEADTRDSRPG